MSTIAETTSGPIQGRVKDDVLLFAGIPYAAAPVGNNRFKAAGPVAPWREVRIATRFGPAAPQVPSGGMTDNAPVNWNEDCLFLNICTPSLDDSRRPVLFWIHGGGYRTGQGAIPWYNGASFALNGDIVVVSINYRLGAFGFTDLSRFGEEYATSGVNGILDQITALAWVRENIAGFGGDPDQVTIAGESAGGFAVATLLGCDPAQGLFHRAIAQSGAAHHTLSSAAGNKVADQLLAEVGTDAMAGLLQASADEILQAQLRVDESLGRRKDPVMGSVAPFYPVTGNEVLAVDPLTAIKSGVGHAVDVMLGSNKDEATLFIMGEVADEKLASEADNYGGGEALIGAYKRNLPGASVRELSIALSTDFVFRIPALRLAEARCEQQAETWLYLFNWESRNPKLKSTHALEIPFCFNNLSKPGVDTFIGEGPVPQGVADTMHAAWISFIRDGSPGWPAYELVDRATMCFDEESALVLDPDRDRRAAWDGIR
jgi:para-nitrobenzyl esterase